MAINYFVSVSVNKINNKYKPSQPIDLVYRKDITCKIIPLGKYNSYADVPHAAPQMPIKRH